MRMPILFWVEMGFLCRLQKRLIETVRAYFDSILVPRDFCFMRHLLLMRRVSVLTPRSILSCMLIFIYEMRRFMDMPSMKYILPGQAMRVLCNLLSLIVERLSRIISEMVLWYRHPHDQLAGAEVTEAWYCRMRQISTLLLL